MCSHSHAYRDRHLGSKVKQFQAHVFRGTLSFSAVRMQRSKHPPSGAQPQPTAESLRAYHLGARSFTFPASFSFPFSQLRIQQHNLDRSFQTIPLAY